MRQVQARAATPAPTADRILSRGEVEALFQRIRSFGRDGGVDLVPEILTWWTGQLRWGRNKVMMAGDRREVMMRLRHRRDWPWLRTVETNQLDDASLQAAVQLIERNESQRPAGAIPAAEGGGFAYDIPALPQPRPVVWSEATYNQTPEARGAMVGAVVAAAAAQQLLSAGYMEMRAGSWGWLANGELQCTPFTQAQCALTVRDPQGTGSGWAGGTSYDGAKLDVPELGKRALAKCVASRNPVALEPGRYTVILEPQAVADLLESLVHCFWRAPAEFDTDLQIGPFKLSRGYSRLGLQVIDKRLTLGHDPMDPALGIVPAPGMRAVNWIEQGVLTNLAYPRQYALDYLTETLPTHAPELGYRLSGGDTSVDEMIATTQRGLLVTRLAGMRVTDIDSFLATGLTRDGLWLIENGKITKPVKNFRFMDSPLAVLNQVEQLGVPVPVFRPADLKEFETAGNWAWGLAWGPHGNDKDWYGADWLHARWPIAPGVTPAIVPPIKARDFNFIALADAV